MTQTKTLIAVVSARHRPEWRRAIRETWLPKVPRDKADAFFFVGEGDRIEDLEQVVQLSCLDDYNHLPSKVQNIAKWALEQGYSHMLKTDDDAVLRANTFLSSGYDQHPYTGRSNRPDSPYAVPLGFGYTLNRECMEIVVQAKLPPTEELPSPLDDERWVAWNLNAKSICLFDDKRYFLHQFMIPKEGTASRPLRAPKRPVVHWGILGPQPEPGTFSYCVHLCCEVSEKVSEFRRLWEKFGEK